LPPDVKVENEGGLLFFSDLPPSLRSRLFYDPLNFKLKFRGQFVQPPIGEYYLLLNVISGRERDRLKALSADTMFPEYYQHPGDECDRSAAADECLRLSRAHGWSCHRTGYVSLAFGNNTNTSAPSEPISIAIIKVTCPVYQGEIKTVESDNAFDEKLTLRHSGDFGGKAEQYDFEWLYHEPDPVTGQAPALSAHGGLGDRTDHGQQRLDLFHSATDQWRTGYYHRRSGC